MNKVKLITLSAVVTMKRYAIHGYGLRVIGLTPTNVVTVRFDSNDPTEPAITLMPNAEIRCEFDEFYLSTSVTSSITIAVFLTPDAKYVMKDDLVLPTPLTLSQAAPLVNTESTYVFQPPDRFRIRGLIIPFVASANVANRYLGIQLIEAASGSTVWFQNIHATPVTAGLTAYLQATDGIATVSQTITDMYLGIALPIDMRCNPGNVIRTICVNRDSLDQWGIMTIFVDRYR